MIEYSTNFSEIDEEDLLKISYMNEEPLLSTLQNRYARDEIYTQIGENTLVSLNPFKIIKNQDNIISKKNHIFSVCNNALKNVNRYRKNQSIVVSGESGSGKTESTILILKFFSSPKKIDEQKNEYLEFDNNMDNQILASDTILEAFGNAKTILNDNSSRFGKAYKISLGFGGKLIKSSVQSYLLERSRVTEIQGKERNYHIFYYLLRGASKSQREKYYLEDVNCYEYLKKGDTYSDLQDSNNFIKILNSFQLLNFSETEIDDLLSAVSAILQLGNMAEQITGDEQSSFIPNSDKYLVQVSNLLKLQNSSTLISQICNSLVQDPISKFLTQSYQSKNQVTFIYSSMTTIQQMNSFILFQARQNVDNLCQILYDIIFKWIITKLNQVISIQNKDKSSQVIGNINIIDMVGFQNNERNSFEQFCINYANEKLQYTFNDQIFKSEQKDYLEEGIPWMNIEFKDNKNIIDIFERNYGSLLGYLDDESNKSDGNDQRFITQLKQNLIFQELKGVKNEKSFTLNHSEGEVEYQVNNFIEKNREISYQSFQELLLGSKNGIIMSHNLQKVENIKGTVSSQLKKQLNDLISDLKNSTNFYIKCIKPNTAKFAFYFDISEVRRQVESAGLLEIAKLRKNGYSLRQNYEEFLDRYGILKSRAIIQRRLSQRNSFEKKFNNFSYQYLENNMMEKSRIIMDLVDFELYQLGKTKIFFNEKGREYIEKVLNKLFDRLARTIQKEFKKFLKRKKKRFLKIVLSMQKIFRKNKLTRGIQQHKGAEKFQQDWHENKIEQKFEMRDKYEQKDNQIVIINQMEKFNYGQKTQDVVEKKKKTAFKQNDEEYSARNIMHDPLDNLSNHEFGIKQAEEHNKWDNLNSKLKEEINLTPLQQDFYVFQSPLLDTFNKEIRNFNSSSSFNFQSSIQEIPKQDKNHLNEIGIVQSPFQIKQFNEQEETNKYLGITLNIPPYIPIRSPLDYQKYSNDETSQKIKKIDISNNSNNDKAHQNQINTPIRINNFQFEIPSSQTSNNIQNCLNTVNNNSNHTLNPSEIINNENHNIEFSHKFQSNMLTSEQEKQILELLKERSKIFCPPSALASFSMSNYLGSVNSINEFLQLVQTQIMHQAKDILELNESLSKKDDELDKREQQEYILEKKLDEKLLNHAIEIEKLRTEILSLKNSSTNSITNITGQIDQQTIDLETKLKEAQKDIDKVKLTKNDQISKISLLEKEKLKLERSIKNKDEELQNQIKIIKKQKQKDKYNEKILQGVFQVIKDKDEELDLLKVALKGNDHLLPKDDKLDKIIQKQQQSLQYLNSLYKPPPQSCQK